MYQHGIVSIPLILIIYIWMPSCNIATLEGSISINGTTQGSFRGGRGRLLFNLTNIGVPVGYSGTDNHLTCATWILSNDKNRITHAYKDLPPLTKVTTEPHLFIFSFNFLTPVIGWSDVNSTPQIFARVCTVHNLTSTSAPLYSWRVKCFNKPLTYVFEPSYGLLLWESKQRVSRLIGGGECTGSVTRKYSEYTRAIDASQCFLCLLCHVLHGLQTNAMILVSKSGCWIRYEVEVSVPCFVSHLQTSIAQSTIPTYQHISGSAPFGEDAIYESSGA